MAVHPGLRIVPWALLAATSLWATPPPVAVSPGDGSNLSAIEARCPTFSWATVARARGYELVVYAIEAGGERAEPLLRERLSGGVGSWTPSLDRCLERGARYAWSIRAVGRRESSEWSPPRLFQVAASAEPESPDPALVAVRVPGGMQGSGGTFSPGRVPVESAATPGPPPAGRAAVGPTPRSHAGAGSAILVDGAVVETKADPPCYPTNSAPDRNHRFVNCGNGTVYDTLTGLFWLEQANCRSCPTPPCPVEAGRRDWWTAQLFAAGLGDGLCGLSDHSQPGDWRLATQDEWLGILEPSACAAAPKIAGKEGNCYADAGNAWALEVPTGPFTFYWTASPYSVQPTFVGIGVIVAGGEIFISPKTDELLAWPVRAGR